MNGALLAAGTSSDAGKTLIRSSGPRSASRSPEEHLDAAALRGLIGGGVPAGLPTVVSGLVQS